MTTIERLQFRVNKLTAALWETASRHHSVMEHPGVMDECNFLTCKEAAEALRPDPLSYDGPAFAAGDEGSDPRTPEQIGLDEWAADWRETYQSNYPTL